MTRFTSPALRGRPTVRFAGAVVLTCFGLGIGGAFGAHAVETRMAVSDARAAAQDLESKRVVLEGELSEAQNAIREAEHVVDEAQVAAAAEALSAATQKATERAALSGLLVSAAPLEPTEDTDPATPASRPEATAAQHPPAPTSSQGAVPVDNTVSTVDATPEPESTLDAPGSRDTPSPAPSSAPSRDAEPSSAGPTIPTHGDVGADADVARVLAGDTASADEAREAARRLAQAAEALDHAVKAVEDGSEALSAAALEAAHVDTVTALDIDLVDASQTVIESAAIIGAVADRVRASGPLEQAADALAAFESATATAALVDREDPMQVVEQHEHLAASRAALTPAMDALRVTHEAWIRQENLAIDARNDLVRADHEEAVAQARAAHTQANRDAVAARTNGWKGRPAGVAGTNGALRSDNMCDVDFAPGHRLQCDAARSLEQANTDYHAQTGHDLSMTDSYRSYGLQVRTRALKPATAARPGTSNHGWGMAVDLDRPSSAWLTTNGEDYGWVHPSWAKPGGKRPEFWHLEYVAADVGAFEAPAAPALEERARSAFAAAPADEQ